MKAIVCAYWRSIRRGVRSLEQVPEDLRAEVRSLAKQDLEAGDLLSEDYERLIGS